MAQQNLYGVRDELEEAVFSGNKELQEKIEKGEVNRYSPTEFNDRRKHFKKRDIEIKQSWRNAEEANQRDYDRAIADNTEVIRLDPNDAGAYYKRGNAYRRKEDYDKAIADYEAVLRIEPDNVDAKTSLEIARRRG